MPSYTTFPDSALSRINVGAEFFTHFLVLPAGLTASGLDTDAAIAIMDAVGGYAQLTTGGDSPGNNDGVIVRTDGEVLKFDSAHAFRVRSKVKFTPTESDTDNVMAVGVMNAPAHATFLGNDGAGPPANYWGACIYKVDGGTKWICEVSAGTDQQTLTTEYDADGAEHVFEIEYKPTDSGRGQVTFRIDGEIIRVPNTIARDHFVPEITLTSATEMAPVIGLRKGDAAAAAVAIEIDAFGFAVAMSD